MNWGKRVETSASHQRRKRLPRILLASLLAATLVPAMPGATFAPTAPGVGLTPLAYADEGGDFVGTTNYEQIFDINNHTGEPATITGSTLRVATTLGHTTDEPKYAVASDGSGWASCAAFMTKNKVSLLHSWEIRATPGTSFLETNSDISYVTNYFGLGLSSESAFRNATGYGWNYSKRWYETTGETIVLQRERLANGTTQERFSPSPSALWNNGPVVFRYDAPSDTLTLEAGGAALPGSARSLMKQDSAYLFLAGSIYWTSKAGTTAANAPRSTLELTFESMALPNLTPEISAINLFRYNKDTSAYDIPVGKYDALDDNEVVKVHCIVRNANPGATRGSFTERFSMHLKLANSATHPTQGIDPFADASHPLEVDGATIATAPGPETLTGSIGVPLELVGYNTPVDVSYFARVNQTGGQAVKVSHEFIEDTFQGSRFATAELIAEQQLKPAPPNVDPDDPNSGAGKDFHYTRLPAANENGWNRGPVTVTFYGGDFDQFTVGDEKGGALGILKDRETWVRTEDTPGLGVTLQAKSSATGALSTKDSDRIKIDSQAPALSYDAVTGTLTADDTAAPGSGKAVSGIWKVEQALSRSSSAFANEQTNWTFSLVDGTGAATQTVTDAVPGFYVATDAAGNQSPVFEVKTPDAPANPSPNPPAPDDPNKPTTPDGPGTTAPAYPTVTPRPTDTAPNPKPLMPTTVDRDSSTGLTHAYIEDALTLPCSSKPVSPEMMATLIAERYLIGAGLTDEGIAASEVRLFGAEGNPAAVIDRTRPGTWYAEQTFTDAAGNRTTLRLAITVREDTASGSLSSAGGNTAGTGSAGNGSGNGRRTALATTLAELPQTGGVLGPCPLHVLFVLLALMATAYSLMRLRQRRTADAALGSHRYHAFDALVHFAIIDGALILAWLAFCPWDYLYAAGTIAVTLFWAWRLARFPKSAKPQSDFRTAEGPAEPKNASC